MIGDSLRADVHGATDVGLPAILVRESHPDVEDDCEDLGTVGELLDQK